MILIEDVSFNGLIFKFYNGIDFDILINHAKDGSKGFIFCFIDNYVKEVKTHNRNNKLKSLIDNTKYYDFDWNDINNDFISIYQADGIGIDLLYKSIREKVIKNNIPSSPYLHITEIDDKGIINSGGAWKVESKIVDEMSKNNNYQ